MKISKDFPYESEPVTQTLQGLSEEQQNTKKMDPGALSSPANAGGTGPAKETKVYEPRPLTPQDPVYSDIMEQFGARPVKPKYWFEEFGEYWSCSCGHINNGDICEGCGLERQLLRQLFILHKPQDAGENANEPAAGPAKKVPVVIPPIVPIEKTPKQDASGSPDETAIQAASQLPAKANTQAPGALSRLTKNPRNLVIALAIAALLAGSGGLVYYETQGGQETLSGSASDFFAPDTYAGTNTLYKGIGEYTTSDTVLREAYVTVGDNCYDKKKYKKAIAAYKKAQDIKDDNAIKDKINAAKFGYVKANQSEGGDQFESYLAELKKLEYPGIGEIYDKYYAWHMKIVANGSEEDYKTNQDTFHRSDTVFFHISLTGGEPDEKIKLYYTLTWPGGAREMQNFDSQWKSGSKITAHFSYPIAMFGQTGKMTFCVYDSESNEELGSKTITFTD